MPGKTTEIPETPEDRTLTGVPVGHDPGKDPAPALHHIERENVKI